MEKSHRKSKVSVAADGDQALRAAFEYCAARYRKLPDSRDIRKAWVARLVGMLQNIESLLAVPAAAPVTMKPKRPKDFAIAA